MVYPKKSEEEKRASVNAKSNRYNERHRELVNAKARERWRADPAKGRNRRLLARYGISLVEYNNLMERQKGKCALCGLPFETERTQYGNIKAGWLYPDVDHDHKTGKVRGLLHRKCNILIGFIENEGIALETIQRYLKVT